MIDKKLVESVVNEWLQDKDYFLVDAIVSADNCALWLPSTIPKVCGLKTVPN